MKPHRLLLLAALTLASLAVHADTLPNRPVAKLDLSRYMGRWHEIAHLPMFFQRKCADHVTATYSRLPDGRIRVVNACRTHGGTMATAHGVARPAPSGIAGALKVRFAPRWLSWLHSVWADYWVLEIGPEYRWAVVGGPSRKYLWVLSRSPTMSTQLLDAIKARAAQRGYPIDKLIVDPPLN